MSFKEIEKERIRNILGYFVKESNKDILLKKLFKMLFFLDRSAYLETGVPLTGYTYHAKGHGPVPMHLELELKNRTNTLDPELVGACSVIKRKKSPSPKAGYEESNYVLVDKGWELNKKVFTPYEIQLLKKIADVCREKTGAELEQDAHKCVSWKNAYKEGKGDGNPLNFCDEDGSASDLYTNGDPYTKEEREVMTLATDEIAQLLSDAGKL